MYPYADGHTPMDRILAAEEAYGSYGARLSSSRGGFVGDDLGDNYGARGAIGSYDRLGDQVANEMFGLAPGIISRADLFDDSFGADPDPGGDEEEGWVLDEEVEAMSDNEDFGFLGLGKGAKEKRAQKAAAREQLANARAQLQRIRTTPASSFRPEKTGALYGTMCGDPRLSSASRTTSTRTADTRTTDGRVRPGPRR